MRYEAVLEKNMAEEDYVRTEENMAKELQEHNSYNNELALIPCQAKWLH